MITSYLSSRTPRRFHAQPSRLYSSRIKPSSPLYLAPSPNLHPSFRITSTFPLVHPLSHVTGRIPFPRHSPTTTRRSPLPLPRLHSPLPRLVLGSARLVLIIQSTCVMNCTDKFLKHSERVGARFAEHNAGMSLAFPLIISVHQKHIEFHPDSRILLQSRRFQPGLNLYAILISYSLNPSIKGMKLIHNRADARQVNPAS